MVKILFFIESLSGGGAEKVLFDVVKGLDKSKYDILVKTITNNGVYYEDVKRVCKCESILNEEFNRKGLFYKMLYKIKYKLIYKLPSKYIYKRLIKDKYDIEVAFVEGFATKIIGSSNNRKSKKIAWIHIDPIERGYADKYFKNIKEHIKCYECFDKVVCVSDSVKEAVKNKYRLNDKQLITQYNPIDRDNVIARSLEKIQFKKTTKLRIISVGRLVNQKGYDRLLKAINKLRGEVKNDFELFILGEGELRSELEDYINSNNLNEVVKILGFVENPYKYIAKSDLFICSSRAEGFSLVIAEALVLGIPVISTNCSGPNELLNFGEYGMLVNNNENDLYKGLKEILNSNKLLEELKNKAKKRSNSFNYNETIDKIENYILQN